MTGYLLKILALLCVSNFVIYIYYFVAIGHNNSYEGFLPYILAIIVLYFAYRMFIQFMTRDPKKVSIKLTTLFGLFLFHLLLLCCFYFYFNGESFQNGFSLFSTIGIYSLFPVSIFTICYGFGDSVLQRLSFHKKQSEIFQFLSGLGLGFTAFITFLVVLGIAGFYNGYTVGVLLLLMMGVGIFSILKLGNFFLKHELHFDNDPKDPNFSYFTSTEFLFFVLTLIISTNLISVVRPVPIGWDDLGVYMNYPHLMAQASELLSLGGMYAWQVFTGVAFMTGSNTQAFFFNSIGGMMSFLVIYLMFKDLFSETKNTFLNIPLLLVTSLAAMPMIMFQLAKDMKLDPGLLFVSSIALYILYYSFTRIGTEKKHEGERTNYIFLVAVLIGFAFTIKVTSLLLLSGVLGLVVYRSLGIRGFLGYLGVYFAVFTKLGLWKYMNVSYPDENMFFINLFSSVSLVLGVGMLTWGYAGSSEKIAKQFLKYSFVILTGFLLVVSPWIGKNFYEAFPNISVGTLLAGKADVYKPDYGLIHSKDKIAAIKLENTRTMTASGTTANEDWGRYFGYEKGINNYLKLPLNLTVQKNQKGEFTDIGFLYLAFLPIIFLFLPYRKKGYVYVTLTISMVGFFALFFPPTALYISHILSLITLPFGYIVILGIFLLWIILLCLIDKEKKLMKLFEYNLIFALFYTFLWTISAYGVVWYGIVMYLSFLLMIGISLYYVCNYKKSDTPKDVQTKLFGSIVMFIIFAAYFLMSTIPQSLNNIVNAGHKDYKLNTVSANETVFGSQAGYLEAIYSMNIAEESGELFLDNTIKNEKIRSIMKNETTPGILKIVNTLKTIQNDTSIQDITLKKDAKDALILLYKKILDPDPLYKNTKYIYRIGTFLSYYISENNSRLLQDSLLFKFNDYVYDIDNTKTLENFKALGLDYILVDLNAATIDKDERKNLTKRYEKILDFYPTDNMELLASDSICLKIGLNKYTNSAKTIKDKEEFMLFGGVNYESFTDQGDVVSRQEKTQLCHQEVNVLLKLDDTELYETGYGFLLPLKSFLISNDGKQFNVDDRSRFQFLAKYVPTGRFALFKIK